ncbi:unnamed protein product, partial [Iphiclides podalirius]
MHCTRQERSQRRRAASCHSRHIKSASVRPYVRHARHAHAALARRRQLHRDNNAAGVLTPSRRPTHPIHIQIAVTFNAKFSGPTKVARNVTLRLISRNTRLLLRCLERNHQAPGGVVKRAQSVVTNVTAIYERDATKGLRYIHWEGGPGVIARVGAHRVSEMASANTRHGSDAATARLRYVSGTPTRRPCAGYSRLDRCTPGWSFYLCTSDLRGRVCVA